MTRHLFKLVWNRKGANLLIALEVFASFLVVFALAAFGIHMGMRWSRPLGYQWEDVWTVKLWRNTQDPWSRQDLEVVERMLRAARSHPEVIAAGAASTAPYGGSTSIYGWPHGDRTIRTEVSLVTPGIMDVLRLDLVAGRWFQPGDEATDWRPVVVDQELASMVVEGGDPLALRPGQRIGEKIRIVGVVRDFRRRGELNEDMPYTLVLAPREKAEDPESLGRILVRVAPGTTAALEEPLLRSLNSIAPDWTLSVTSMEAARASRLREKLIPTAVVGVVAVFLLFMVVLGLTGVMWQNVTRRTREFGLRRAVGAHRIRIQRQIIGEVAVTAGLGVLAGSLLASQAPLLGPFSFVPWSVVLLALGAAAAMILTLAAICGLYPGWTATRIHPAEALHYE